MVETTDLLVSRLFYSQAYEQVLPLLTRLIDLGINLDINLARRWECQLVLGKEGEARRDWESLQPMVKPWEPAPAQHSGLHTRYPNYDFWQLFGYLRMAQAHLQWAEGGDPCKHVVKKKTSVSNGRRDRHLKTADDYVSTVLRKMEEFTNTYNAFEAGPIFAELRVELTQLEQESITGRLPEECDAFAIRGTSRHRGARAGDNREHLQVRPVQRNGRPALCSRG